MANVVLELPLADIRVSEMNPRKHLDEKKMAELTASVKEKGVIEPIKVRPAAGGKYEIVYGKRRYTASGRAGLKTIPAIVQQMTDNQMLEYQVIENLQREDLNPVDEAAGFKLMIDRLKYTPQDLASRVGKSPAFIRDRVRLLELPANVQACLASGELMPGHGQVLLRLTDQGHRKELFEEMRRDKMSVRAAENCLNNYGQSLDRACFPKEACRKCDWNGSNQKELFDAETRLKGQCLNRTCYLQKNEAEINRRRHKFWVDKVAGAEDDRVKTAVALNSLLDELSQAGGDADELVPFKSRSFAHSWSIPRLYDLGLAKMKEIIGKTVTARIREMTIYGDDDKDLSFLAGKLGFEVSRDFIITEEYLQAYTKDKLLKLAGEIGLIDHLKKKSPDEARMFMDGLGKAGMIEYFINEKANHGFKLAGRVPKEMK